MAVVEAGRLLARLEESRSVDIFTKTRNPNAELTTAPLFGRQRGKMFGVLECLDREEKQIWLYGFSGQYNGRWLIPGWTPPLFDVDTFRRVNDPVEEEIKHLGRQIVRQVDTQLKKKLEIRRKNLSRQLMKQLHALYVLYNFRGRTMTLEEATGSSANLPTGIGDCCAPKLLNRAARLGYTPVSLSEFYFGRSNLSDTRQHGNFYPPCTEKCSSLLGFLLCGASTT